MVPDLSLNETGTECIFQLLFFLCRPRELEKSRRVYPKTYAIHFSSYLSINSAVWNDSSAIPSLNTSALIIPAYPSPTMCELYKLSSKLCNCQRAKHVHLCALNDYSHNN